MLTRISAVRPAATLGLTRGPMYIRRPVPSASVFNLGARRLQSSSSSSHDNDNNPDLSSNTVTSNEPSTTNASLELHRVDLAHGSFFALHRPLLGIANGPMFAPPNNHMIHDEEFEGKSNWNYFTDPVDDLAHLFATLQPFSPPPTPVTHLPSLSTATATAWASIPQAMPEAEQAVDEFFSILEEKQARMDAQISTDDKTSSVITEEPSGKQIMDPVSSSSTLEGEDNVLYMTSVLRKRRIKMRKHKYKKLRKRTRALRKKLGK
ncbi:hypothetical protein BG000_008230 [Podila horticola]|nr:hypothetical protein BG000_008230 [Podila horticola]